MTPEFTWLDVAVREIAFGAWSISATCLAMGFLWYGLKTLSKGPIDRRDVAWTAIVLALVFGGSALRVFEQWREFALAMNGMPYTPVPSWPWLLFSVIASMIGAAGCFYFLSPYRWRWWITIGCMSMAMGVPLWVYWYYWFAINFTGATRAIVSSTRKRKEVRGMAEVTKADIGKACSFFDPRGVRHDALITNVFGSHCVNVIYVNDNEAQTDDYGRKMMRATSVMHGNVQQAHGNYWMMPGEEREKPAPYVHNSAE
jgi:hypothetical protein